MVRLSDIPKEKLKKIERFVRQQKGKVPVTGGGWGIDPETGKKVYVKNLVELVEEKFGVRLSPAQIYALQRGRRKKKVVLEKDVAEWLEEKFGSVSKGIREVARIAEKIMAEPPPKYKHAVSQLGGRTLDYDEAVWELKQLGYENPDEVIRELFRLGFARNVQGKLAFYRYRVPPEFELLRFFAGMVK